MNPWIRVRIDSMLICEIPCRPIGLSLVGITSRRSALNNSFSKVALWIVIGLVLFTVFKQFDGRGQSQDTVSYTQFMDDAKAGKVRKVDVQSDVLYVTPDSGRPYTLTSPGDLWMVSDLMKAGVQVSGKAREEDRKSVV